MEDKRYPIELEVITPLSVGAGNDNEWTKGIDFIEKEDKVYVIDMQKAVAQGINMSRLAELFLKRDSIGVASLFGRKLETVSRLVFDSPVPTSNNIKTFLRTQLYDKPVVAGSSIKGAVRSALFSYLRDNERKNEEVFGNMKDGTDFMRFIHIGDVELPHTSLVNSKIFNLRGHGSDWQGGWKHANTGKDGNSHTDGNYSPTGFNTLYECALPGMKGIGNITLAKGAFALAHTYGKPYSHSEKKQQLINGSLSELFKVINDSTREYLRKEKLFFEEYPADRTDELVDNIDYLMSLIPEDGSSCLLKMSVGVGFHSITGDWQHGDYTDTGEWNEGRDRGKKKSKSRKTVEYNKHLQLMGFVRLRMLTAEELETASTALVLEHEERIKHITSPNRLLEPVVQPITEEQLQREQQRKAEAEKRNKYEKLIEAAQKYYLDNVWAEAIAKAAEAKALYPDESPADEMIEKCNKAKAAEEYQGKIEQESKDKFKRPLPEVIKGKSSLGNLMGTIEKWLKINNKPFGDDEYVALVEAVKLLPTKEQKQLQKKQGTIIKTIGEGFAKRLLSEKNE